MDTNSLLAKYERPVPRYTSYPTAPHFTPAVDGAVHSAWLQALPPEQPVSLYLHVPFCDSLCRFCGCNTSVARRPEPLVTYAGTLLAEIELVTRAVGARLPVSHVHWGGGTPTTLPADWMLTVGTRLREHFDLRPDAEIAVEIDPRTLSSESLAAMAEMGVRRASIGVQDFDPLVQRTVGRIQPYDVTAACAQRLRGIGIASLNLDLMYGLPYQTVASVRATMRQAAGLQAERVAVFGYAHVPWMKKHQSLLRDEALPGAMERFEQRAAVEEELLAAGYEAIGLDHFALPGDPMAVAARAGRLKRNFQGYTTDAATALIGLGASSISALPQGYAQNLAAVPAWRDAVRAGRLPTARGVALSEEDRLRGAVIERLMCALDVDLVSMAMAYGADPGELLKVAPALAAQAADGLIEWDGRSVRVTARGKPFLRAVAVLFDAYFQPGPARHAATV